MANRQVNLPAPTVIDAANGLMIGQLTLLYSKVLFEVAISIINGANFLSIPGAWLVLTLVLVVPALMLLNLLVGWIATRNTFNEFEQYPNNLFAIDVLIIVVSFILVNMISFSMLPAGSSDYLTTILFPSNSLKNSIISHTAILESNVVRVLPPFIYGCSGILLSLMLVWNKTYVKEKKRITGKKVDNSELNQTNEIINISLPVHFFLVIGSCLFDSVVVELACVAIWSTIWTSLNVHWILTSPLKTSLD